jgi:hypothetical protein
MIRKLFWSLGLISAVCMPLSADTQTEVGVAFIIESPEIFPDSVLGNSKSVIESEMSQIIADRLELYFPFLDWKAGSEATNRVLVKLVDRENGLCDWQADLVVRAYRSGTEIEMVDVPATPLYDLCDPFVPNRINSTGDALDSDDKGALIEKLKRALENSNPSPGEPKGLFNNNTIRDAIHRDFLSTIPLTQRFELREQPSGSEKRLYLPVSFEDLKSSTDDLDCSDPEGNCSRLRLTVQLADSSIASFTLRVVGRCGDMVLCEVLDGGVPGGYTVPHRTYWDDGLGDLLNQATRLSFTMMGFRQKSFPCPFSEL